MILTVNEDHVVHSDIIIFSTQITNLFRAILLNHSKTSGWWASIVLQRTPLRHVTLVILYNSYIIRAPGGLVRYYKERNHLTAG